jgi:plastocyanin
VTVTLGPTAGGQTITATSSGLSGSPATFSATANPGNAFALTLNGQSANSGFPGVVLTYSVKVSDSHGNGKPGIPILWAASFGGGTVVPDSNDTNAGGVATTQHHLGAAFGEDSVTATAKTALQGSPVKFQATIAQAPAADTVTVGPGLTFNPTSVTIRNGGTVTFNFAGGSHGVHWTGGPATPADIPTTSSGSTTVPLNTSGTYTYNCTVHGNSMTGSINVQ